jgi:hypothetical protein
MYSNEPPRPGSPRRESTRGDVDRDFNRDFDRDFDRDLDRDFDRDEAGPRGRSALGGNGPSGPGSPSSARSTDGSRGTDGPRGADGPRGDAPRGNSPRTATGHGGSGHGRPKSGSGNGRSGGNRTLLIVGGTAGVIVLALIAYFVTRPSNNSNASGPTANATSQTSVAVNPPAPSTPAGGPATSPAASTTAGASASASPSTSAPNSAIPSNTVAVNLALVHVQVFNGTGINQRAASIKTYLVNQGFALATVGGTDAKTPTTKVYFPSTRADSAAAVAHALAIPGNDLSVSANYTEVTVVIGTDWSSGNTYPAG